MVELLFYPDHAYIRVGVLIFIPQIYISMNDNDMLCHGVTTNTILTSMPVRTCYVMILIRLQT